MAITYYPDMIQGSDEWFAARCGMLASSGMKLIITPKTLKPSKNDKASSYLYELLAQRITRYVEPQYVSEDMLRGTEDEIVARQLYQENFAPVQTVGFVTNDKWGFTIGYSPDGLVGDDGLIECKSRRQKFQAETIISGEVPEEHVIQIQTGLMVTGRKWCDYISYCRGMPMAVIQVYPDEKVMQAIVDAASILEERLAELMQDYNAALASGARFIPTERRTSQEMYV